MFKLNFYESFAFLSRGHSIFYPNPSPKDERFSNRWGGGGVPTFFQSPQNFDPSDKFFKGANVQRMNPSDFIFQRAATKI